MWQKWRASLTHLGGDGGRERELGSTSRILTGLCLCFTGSSPPACGPTFLCSLAFPNLEPHLTHLCTCRPAARRALLDIHLLDPPSLSFRPYPQVSPLQ